MNDNARERWYQYAKENAHIDRETRWKQFYELNKDELDADYKKIDDMRKEKARNYYEEHKEEIRAKARARYPTHYEKNKDKLNEQRRNNDNSNGEHHHIIMKIKIELMLIEIPR